MSASPSTLVMSELTAEFGDRVLGPDSPGYDEARLVVRGDIDRRPAAILRPADAKEVSRIVSMAAKTGLELAVRSGGHSGVGHSVSEGGIVIDLHSMRAIDIDVEGRTAWAETGATAGEFAVAAGAHGLATGFGDTGSVGIGGITLGGGIGFLVRKYGMTIDSLLAAELVTADGEILQVDETSHPDLFWAIRGGGGNFGVATKFKFRLHEVDSFVGGMLVLPATADVITAFMAAAEAAPEELSTIANVMTAPPMPFLPAEVHGTLIMLVLMGYAGPADEADQVLAPFRALATPLADMLRPLAYHEMFPPEGEGYRPVSASRNLFLDSFDRGTAEMILRHLSASDAMMRATQLRMLGGAMSRVAPDATAYAHRQRKIMINLAAVFQDPAEMERHEAWVTDFAAAMSQGEPGAYVGFQARDDEDAVREIYPAATWQRLAEVKRRYDPDNLFRMNHNIPPAVT